MRTILIAAVIALSAATARGEEIRNGTGLICDTAEQIAAYLQADGDGKNAAAALSLVNGDAAPVCGIASIAYVPGSRLKQVLTKQGVLDVVEIIVVGANVNGTFQPISPQRQITVFAARGVDI